MSSTCAAARVLLDGTAHLDDDIARRVVDQVADDAWSYTTGQLRARLRRLCIEAEPDDATPRYEDAVQERRVAVEANDSGTVNLFGMDLPPDRATAAAQRINRIARSLRHEGEDRTMDQLRADVYLDLLCGTNHTTTGRGVVDLRVDLDTLAELNNHPGDLAGYGPVIADIARKVAEDETDAEWRYTITNPDTGQPIHTGTTRRRPTAAQRRAVEARNPTCVFPGCRMPAIGSDLDHRTTWARRRTHHRSQPRTTLPPRPLHPPPTRMDLQTPPQRHPPMDQPTRPHLHHQRNTPIEPPPTTGLG